MRMTRRDIIVGALAAAGSVPSMPALAGAISFGGPAFGSSWRASLAPHVDPRSIGNLVQGIVDDVDSVFSPFRTDSALYRFNQSRTALWQPVPSALSTVAREALRIADLTDGYFDPTIGHLVARQGFGPIVGVAAEISDFETADQGMRKAFAGATLDLCGIAKGFALDRIVRTLEQGGVKHAIVDVGGEVKAIGAHPDGRRWTVAIADPAMAGQARRIVAPGELALATSGHSANGVNARARATHIIDPHHQGPASQELLSVSVLDRSATYADAMATALCAAGPERGPELAERLAICAYFISDNAEWMTGGFETHILS